MQFEGTQHFPRQGINEFLASLGLGIGPDANAATSYDDTQYTLRVPTDVPGVLDRALLVLEDWAQARHVRSGRHRAPARHRAVRMADAPRRRRAHAGQDPRASSSRDRATRIARRSASPTVIEKAQREQLMRFYRDWYRPDLMAVIVVGDVDRDAVVAMIKAHFSSLDRRRRRSGRGRRSTCPSSRARATPSSPTRKRRPPRSRSATCGRRATRDTVGGYRADHAGPAVRRDARRAARRAQPARESAVSQSRRRPPPVPDTPRTKDEALLQALVPERRRQRAGSRRSSPSSSASRASASPPPSWRAPSRR